MHFRFRCGDDEGDQSPSSCVIFGGRMFYLGLLVVEVFQVVVSD